MGNSKEIGEILISNGADINANDNIYPNLIVLSELQYFETIKGN